MALGDVPCHLGISAQRSRVVAQGGDEDVSPEPRAVLAHQPSLVFVGTPVRRDLQFVLRFGALDVPGGVEAREVLTDDLGCRVALDPLRPGIPRRYETVRVEHEDGVIPHALEQQPHALRGLCTLFSVGTVGDAIGRGGRLIQVTVLWFRGRHRPTQVPGAEQAPLPGLLVGPRYDAANQEGICQDHVRVDRRLAFCLQCRWAGTRQSGLLPDSTLIHPRAKSAPVVVRQGGCQPSGACPTSRVPADRAGSWRQFGPSLREGPSYA